jgi:hypothetical protein
MSQFESLKVRGKKASMRGVVVQHQAIAVSALGEPVTLRIDKYDARRAHQLGPEDFAGNQGIEQA